MFLHLIKKPLFSNLWFLNTKILLNKYYKLFFLRIYFILILYFKKINNIFYIWKNKKKLSFHKFDTFIFTFFNLINYNKLFIFNNKNTNKSLLGRKINISKKTKIYKLPKLHLFNLKYTQLYNIIGVKYNLYNYKIHIIICNNWGDMYMLPYMQNINLFKFYSNQYNFETLEFILPYIYIYVYKLQISTIIFNIQSTCKINQLPKHCKYKMHATTTNNFFKKLMYCLALGSIAKINMHIRSKLLTQIILPSKKKIYISFLNICFIYHNQIFKVEEKRKIPKASNKFKLGKKQSVRGIAKNAVDHPHGGNTNIIKIKKNPWGKNI